MHINTRIRCPEAADLCYTRTTMVCIENTAIPSVAAPNGCCLSPQPKSLNPCSLGHGFIYAPMLPGSSKAAGLPVSVVVSLVEEEDDSSDVVDAALGVLLPRLQPPESRQW